MLPMPHSACHHAPKAALIHCWKSQYQWLSLSNYLSKLPHLLCRRTHCHHHTITTKFGEHCTRKAGQVRKHFTALAQCTSTWDDIKILSKTAWGIPFLQALKVLYVHPRDQALTQHTW